MCLEEKHQRGGGTNGITYCTVQAIYYSLLNQRQKIKANKENVIRFSTGLNPLFRPSEEHLLYNYWICKMNQEIIFGGPRLCLNAVDFDKVTELQRTLTELDFR